MHRHAHQAAHQPPTRTHRRRLTGKCAGMHVKRHISTPPPPTDRHRLAGTELPGSRLRHIHIPFAAAAIAARNAGKGISVSPLPCCGHTLSQAWPLLAHLAPSLRAAMIGSTHPPNMHICITFHSRCVTFMPTSSRAKRLSRPVRSATPCEWHGRCGPHAVRFLSLLSEVLEAAGGSAGSSWAGGRFGAGGLKSGNVLTKRALSLRKM